MSDPQELLGPDLEKGVALGEVPEQGILVGHRDGDNILVVRQDGELFAVSNRCTHYQTIEHRARAL